MSFFPDFKNIFPELVGNFPAKLALVLNLIEPKCGGVLLVGKRGVGKSLLLKLLKKYLKLNNLPFVEIPLNVTEENLTGGLDIEKTLEKGKRIYQKGLLEKAKNGYLLIDNINLLPQEAQSLIFQHSHNYTIVAALNPEEGTISPHFLDKIGMCVFLEKLKEKEKYYELLKRYEIFENLEESYLENYYEFAKWVAILKHRIKELSFSEALGDYIAGLCLKNGVFSHRGEIFLYFAARAFCALKGEFFIKEEHVNFVAPLVLSHRSKKIEEKPKPEEKEPEEKKESQKKEEKPQTEPQQNHKQKKDEKREVPPLKEEKTLDENLDLDSIELKVPSLPKEEVFDIGEVFKLKRFIFKKDRIVRNSGGKRTKSKTFLKGARFVRSVYFSKDRDIDLFGTIKAASPFQKIRGRKDKLIIYKEDFRYKEKEKKVGHLVVFVVDGSGSMAARQRMLATKGAIFSLLMDCYQKRDKVAMILFRKFNAEVVLPPTSSVELAYKKLKDLPTGGNTPLSAGLFSAYQLIKKYHLRFPQDRILLLLLTDGKANIPIRPREDPFKETQNICYEIKNLPYIDSVVIDTEVKSDFLKMDLAKDIAEWLSALYFPLEEIKSENLVNIVKSTLLQIKS